MRVTLASYNIHGGVGSHGRFDPLRTLRVLQALGADMIALQEVAFRHGTGHETLAFLAEETGMHAVAGPTLLRHNAHYGNALLSRWPVLAEHRLDLSFPGREPRGAIGATIACGGDKRLQIVTTHLGLRPVERRYQVRRLLELFDVERTAPAVLLGDLNEWLLWGQPLRWLHAYFKETPAPATFPARFPLFALDRVWVRPRSALVRLAANASELARRASDHLPITAVLECPPDDGPRKRRADSR
jgi:endonuclease/exonuclease/phosphatase family metal-dependent hydrolase